MDIGKRKRVIFVEPLEAPSEGDAPVEPTTPVEPEAPVEPVTPVEPGAPLEDPPAKPERSPEPAGK